MVTDREFKASDMPLLTESLARDEHHKTTKPEFFTASGTVVKVYEDEHGPVLFARGAKALRLDLQYVDNHDKKRNMQAMLEGFDNLANRARDNGFTEVIFRTNSPLLRRFCIKYFHFVGDANELSLQL